MTQTQTVRILVEDLYEKGHGQKTTIQRIQDVCELNEQAATIAFNSALNAIRADEQRWINKRWIRRAS